MNLYFIIFIIIVIIVYKNRKEKYINKINSLKENRENFVGNNTLDINYIENDKYSYTQPSQTIQVTKEGYPEAVVFEYKKKDTTIKVKKF